MAYCGRLVPVLCDLRTLADMAHRLAKCQDVAGMRPLGGKMTTGHKLDWSHFSSWDPLRLVPSRVKLNDTSSGRPLLTKKLSQLLSITSLYFVTLVYIALLTT